MVERWWTEAGRFDVLPLDDRPVWQLVRPPLRGAPTGRTRYVYRPPISHLPVDVSPPHGPRPFRITADLDVPSAGPGPATDGALLNRGTINGGYALLVRDGRLVFHLNRFHHHFRVAAPEPLAPGRQLVGVRVDDRDGQGIATLTIDDAEVATAEVGPLARTLSSLGMDIGRAMAPVSDDYEAPFAYPGRIHQVVFEILAAPDPAAARADAAHAARVELGLQ